MLPELTPAHWLTLHGLVTLLAMLIYVMASHAVPQRRSPSAAIAWVLFILLLPYLALPAFLTFGSRKRLHPRALPQVFPVEPAPDASWAVRSALALAQPAPAVYRALHLHADGAEALAALRGLIDGAASSIDLCTFILGSDVVGRDVVERLAAKARTGLAVRLMVDGLGRWMGGLPDLRPLVRAGGQVAMFVPPLHWPSSGRANLRDHRKMLLVDAAGPAPRLWCGGRNLAVEYFEGRAGVPAWHDLSFDLAGAVVCDCAALFERDWAFASKREPQPVVAAAAAGEAGEGSAQLVACGPDQLDDTVYAMLLTACYQARRRIAIITPYLVPDAALLNALCLAARRGVAIEVLLPARSNHRMSDFARSRALRALAVAGARIELAPQMLHAKLIVVDDVLALAGSANIDSRSLFLNYELMLAFHDRAAIGKFTAWFERERRGAQRHVEKRAGLVRDLAEGLVLWLGFQL